MTEEERQALKTNILKEIESTKSTIALLKEQMQPVEPNNAIGRLSRMEAINERSVQKSSLEAAQIKIRKLQVALERVEDEDFQECQECGEDIPMPMLQLLPEIPFCVNCLSKAS